MDESALICPHCGAIYQQGNSVCPSCGKPLSPTGYSRYGGGEMLALAASAPVETFLPETRPSPLGDTLDTIVIEATPTLQPGPVATADDVTERGSAPITPLVIPPYSPVATQEESEAHAEQQANIMVGDMARVFLAFVVVGAAAIILISISHYTHSNTASTLAYGTPTEPPDPAASGMKISYHLFLNVVNYAGSVNTFDIKVYDLSTDPSIFPVYSALSGAITQANGIAVEFDTSSRASSAYLPNNLAYRRGTVLLAVVNGKVSASKLIIIRDDATAAAQYPPDHYVVAGQVEFGFESLANLRSGNKVKDAGILTDSGKATPTVR